MKNGRGIIHLIGQTFANYGAEQASFTWEPLQILLDNFHIVLQIAILRLMEILLRKLAD